jgi:hypothetical protein
MLSKFKRLVKKVTRGANTFERDQNRLRYALNAATQLISETQGRYRAVHDVVKLFFRELRWRAQLKARFIQLCKTVAKVQ